MSDERPEAKGLDGTAPQAKGESIDAEGLLRRKKKASVDPTGRACPAQGGSASAERSGGGLG